MTDRLTDQQLTEIDAREKAATDGPWGFYDGDNYADVVADLQMTSRASYTYREKVARLENEDFWDDPAHEDADEEQASQQMAANAAFIAHARTDMPALLAEVRRLKGQRKYLIAQLAKRDAESGRGDTALRKFLAGVDPICGDENDGDWCELEPGYDGHHSADTAEWAAEADATP